MDEPLDETAELVVEGGKIILVNGSPDDRNALAEGWLKPGATYEKAAVGRYA